MPDLRRAVNAISDVYTNRPAPIRAFDQIYMKAGDAVIHSEFIARKCEGKNIVFVGDGDSIGLCIAHLMGERILDVGPKSILLLDFDQRLVNFVNQFANSHGLSKIISAELYNVVDPLPPEHLGKFDSFHINPPWGQYNNGESVCVFFQRGVQLLKDRGWGYCVIADDDRIQWPESVLARTQSYAASLGMAVKEMVPAFHSYHLDDAPELKSCILAFRNIGTTVEIENGSIMGERLNNFYGRANIPRIRYVMSLDKEGAQDAPRHSYELVELKESE